MFHFGQPPLPSRPKALDRELARTNRDFFHEFTVTGMNGKNAVRNGNTTLLQDVTITLETS